MKKYLLLVVLFVLAGCGQAYINTAEISGEIDEYLGVTPYLPELDYPIGHAHIEYNTTFEDGEPARGEPWKATIEYKVSQDEQVDDQFREAWEDEVPDREIIYGELYMDQSAVLLSVYKDEAGTLQNAEVIEIVGHEVQYQHIQRGTEAVIMLINFEDIGYEIQYLVEEEDIEEEAKAFAEEIINNH
ncbi:hypothetical protein [Lentibacillus sediminis]|uniref:hypothetical protein n=1 Tax=Lentibacillus sediminis TaxID=1940529 RepID=UPI000C1B93D2|nr:hypothetical protein [Lentibacillus sediminis]